MKIIGVLNFFNFNFNIKTVMKKSRHKDIEILTYILQNSAKRYKIDKKSTKFINSANFYKFSMAFLKFFN